MAVSDFGVTVAADVLPRLPFDSSQITDASRVTTSDLTAWLDEFEGRMAGAVTKAGLTVDGLGSDALVDLRAAIASGVVWRTLDALGFAGATRDNAKATWDESYQQMLSRPDALATRTTDVDSNIDTTYTNSASLRRTRRFGQVDGTRWEW